MKKKLPKIKYLMGNFQFWWLNEEDMEEDYDFEDAHLDLMAKKQYSVQLKILNQKSVKTEKELEFFCKNVAQILVENLKNTILKNEEKENEKEFVISTTTTSI